MGGVNVGGTGVPRPVLQGRRVRLEPLEARHAPDLLECLRADPDLFRYFLPPLAPVEASPAGMERYVAMRADPSRGVALAMIDASSGRAVGSSCFYDLRPEHAGLEIGATFIHPSRRGSAVNPESKLLMLRWAFESWEPSPGVRGAERVQLKCDGRNAHSQRAIAKLGAVREGVLRRHMRMADGFMRDTVMFSILRDEWPAVRARLEARVAAFDGGA